MEKFLLSTMLLKNGEMVPKISAALTAEDFYRQSHRIIFNAIIKLYGEKTAPNVLSLIEELRQSGKIQDVGGINFIYSLSEIAHTTAYVDRYLKDIREKSTLRKLSRAGEEITQEADEDLKPFRDILDNAEKKIFTVTTRAEISEFEHISPIIQRSFERIRQAVNNPKGLTGVETGFADLDKITSGFQKSDLILLAARPSMGKTALALNIAMNAAFNKNVVAVFSLEMSKEQLGHRLISSYSAVDSQTLNTGRTTSEDFGRIIDTLERISATKLFIDDTADISVLDLRSKARQIKSEHGLNFVVIDYLQLMQGNLRKGYEYNRQQEISEISRSLKALARELNVPILALSQLSRGVELRADKRPMLSDLRESGSLEQDADLVMFLYREEYYDHETENANVAELIIAKNRNGPTTNINLYFERECMRFSNYAAEE